MAFPVSPNNGDVYNNYKYNSANDLWEVNITTPAIEAIKKSVSTTAGIKEVFRSGGAGLVSSGMLTLSGTRGGFVHTSIWTWTVNHQAAGYGTLTRHNLGNYGTVTVHLDAEQYGSVILSVEWGGTMSYEYTAQLFHGAGINTSAEGTLHTSPDAGYTRFSAS